MKGKKRNSCPSRDASLLSAHTSSFLLKYNSTQNHCSRREGERPASSRDTCLHVICRDMTYARAEARAPIEVSLNKAPEPAQNRPNHISTDFKSVTCIYFRFLWCLSPFFWPLARLSSSSRDLFKQKS